MEGKERSCCSRSTNICHVLVPKGAEILLRLAFSKMHKVTHGAPFSSTTFTTTIQHQPDSTDEENRLRRESPPPLASISKRNDTRHVVLHARNGRIPPYRGRFAPLPLSRLPAFDLVINR
jgi:hypothetical protein